MRNRQKKQNTERSVCIDGKCGEDGKKLAGSICCCAISIDLFRLVTQQCYTSDSVIIVYLSVIVCGVVYSCHSVWSGL